MSEASLIPLAASQLPSLRIFPPGGMSAEINPGKPSLRKLAMKLALLLVAHPTPDRVLLRREFIRLVERKGGFLYPSESVVGRELANIAMAFSNDILATAEPKPIWLWTEFGRTLDRAMSLLEGDAEQAICGWGQGRVEPTSSLSEDEDNRVRWGGDGGNNCD